MMFLLNLPLAALLVSAVIAIPSTYVADKRAATDNIVYITDKSKFCMIMPRDPHTDIGDSEHPGGMKTYCSSAGRYANNQGKFPDNFWSNVEYKSFKGTSAARTVQLTGCIRPSTLTRLNPKDGGGQYDSSGGAGGRGNPQGSTCLGYNHYVELIEPGANRACIRCCDNPKDCPTTKDTQGCQAVIPGNYFNCG